MASIETIGIDFDTSGLKKGQTALKDTSREADKTADALDKTTGETKRLSKESSEAAGLSSKFATALGGIAIAATALKAIKMADEYTTLNARLQLATKSTAEFATAQENLFLIAQNSRTSLSATMDLYTALSRATKDLTITQSQLLTITDTFSKSVVISGGSSASAAAAIAQFNQAMASGVLRGEEFNSVSEQAPKIIDILAASLGKTRGELRAMANEGQLTSDVVLPAILAGAEGITAEFNKMNTTVEQAATVFMNSTLAMVGTANEATDSTNSLAESIIGMSDILNVFTKAMKDSSGEGKVFSAVLEGAMVVLETGIVLASKAALAFQLVGNALGGAAAAAVALTDSGMKGYNEVLEAANNKALSLVESNNKFTDSILNARKNGEFYRDTMKGLTKAGGEQNSANYQVIKSTGLSVGAQKEAEKASKAAAAAAKRAASESASAAKSAASEALRIQKELTSEREKANKDYVAELNKLHGTYQKSVESSKKLVETAQAEYDQYGLNRTEIEALNIAKQEQILSEMELKQAMNGTYEASKLEIAAMKEKIAAMKQVQGIHLKSDDRTAADKLAADVDAMNDKVRGMVDKTAADAESIWSKASESINGSITDALMRGFESGKGAAKNFRDSLVNMFKSLVLQPIIKMGVQGGLGAIGLGGLSGSAGASTGGMGGLDIVGLLGKGLGLFGGGAASGIGGIAAGASVAGQGATLAASSMGSFATSMGSLATTVGAAVPYIGLALAAFTMLKDKFKGETRSGGGFAINAAGTLSSTGGPSGGDFTKGEAGKQLAAMVQSLDGILKAVGSTSTVTSAQGGLETSTKKRGGVYAGGTLSTGESFGKTLDQRYKDTYTPEEAARSYVNDLNGAIIDGLTKSKIPDAVRAIIESGGEVGQVVAAIQAQTQAVASFSAVIGLLPFAQLSTLGYAAKVGLLEAAGGLDALGGSLKTYYDNFYSESEKAANTTRNMTDALSAVGVALPATREAFRSVVEAQDLTTEAGQKAYAALLGVSGAFAELHPIVVAEKEAVKDLTAAKVELTAAEVQHADLTKTNADLQAQLNTLLGITPVMLDAANAALDANNKTIQAQIITINAEAEAKKQAADSEKTLRDKLFELQATAEQKREKEIASYGESNRALATYVLSLGDAAAGIANAAAVADAALAAIKQAAGQQRSMLDKYDSGGASGRAQSDIKNAFSEFNATDRIPKTAKELADLVAALDPKVDQAALDRLSGLSGAFDSVFGAADAAAKAAQAEADDRAQKARADADAAARSAQDTAERAKQAMRSVYDSIKSALDSLMGQSEQFAEMQRQQAKITLQSALVVAKAGGSLVGFAGLDDALKNVGNIDQGDYGSYADYAREYGQSVGLLSELGKYTKPRGSHANGLDSVPFDGYMARLHKGEQVTTAREVAAGGVVGQEVKSMKEDMKAMLIPLVEEAVRSRRILSKWDGDGMPEVRSVA